MDELSNKLISSLLMESDRGLVLAGAAFLDEALFDLLSTTFRADLSKNDRDALFTHLGPLSSMSSRSLVAYAVGLVDEETRRSLDLVRRIRNSFAHFAGVSTLPAEDIERLLDLGDSSLRTAVRAFGSSDDPTFSEARVKVTLCIVSLWAKLRHKTAESRALRTGS